MNERQWFASTDINQLFNALGRRRRSNQRKGRLFACACCRRVWHLLEDERSRVAVSLSELYADGLVNAEAMKAACNDAADAIQHFVDRHGTFVEDAGDEADEYYDGPYSHVVITDPERQWQLQAFHAAHAAAWGNALLAAIHALQAESHEYRGPQATLVGKAQAALLRDIYGNPYRHFPRTMRTSTTVYDLANALNAGQDCAFALHDALVELNQPKLAKHFATGQHVHGYWVADRILGKT